MKYVVGAMFSEDFKQVALIKKLRPAWQKGKLNLPGGKVEVGEKIHQTMVREFLEETGMETQESGWSHYCEVSGEDFQVDAFTTVGDLSLLRTMEEEEIVVKSVKSLYPLRRDTVDNLGWMVGMAINHLKGGPKFSHVSYL